MVEYLCWFYMLTWLWLARRRGLRVVSAFEYVQGMKDANET